MNVPGPGMCSILGTALTPACLQPRAVMPHPDEPSFPKEPEDTRLSLCRPKAHGTMPMCFSCHCGSGGG